MEAHIEQLDLQIKQTDTVRGLQEGQEEILSNIKKDQEFNEAKFAQGAEKINDLYNKVEEMKKQITDGFKDLGNKVTDNEISRLQKALDKKDNRMWDATKIVLTAVVSIVATFIIIQLGLK